MLNELIKKYEEELRTQQDTITRIKNGEFNVNDDIHIGKASAYQEILQGIKALKEKVNTKSFSCLTINNENHGQNAKAIFIDELIGKEE